MMGDKITLRGLFSIMIVAALILMTLRLPIANQGGNIYTALAVSTIMILSPFLLYAIFFALLLPLGIISDLSRESSAPGESPFATDRLPAQQIAPRDSGVSR